MSYIFESTPKRLKEAEETKHGNDQAPLRFSDAGLPLPNISHAPVQYTQEELELQERFRRVEAARRAKSRN